MKVELNSKIGILGYIKKAVKTDGDKTVYSDIIDINGATSISVFYIFKNLLTGEFIAPGINDNVDILIDESGNKSDFNAVDSIKQLGDKYWNKKYLKTGAVSTEQYLRIKIIGNHLESLGNNELEFNAIVVSSPETFISDDELLWILSLGFWDDNDVFNPAMIYVYDIVANNPVSHVAHPYTDGGIVYFPAYLNGVNGGIFVVDVQVLKLFNLILGDLIVGKINATDIAEFISAEIISNLNVGGILNVSGDLSCQYINNRKPIEKNVVNLGDISGNVEINLTKASYIKANLTGTTNISFSGSSRKNKVKDFILAFTGIQIINWDAGVKFPGGVAPIPSGAFYEISGRIDESGNIIILDLKDDIKTV